MSEPVEQSLRHTISRIISANNDDMWPNDDCWVQFVKDHYKQIKESSHIHVLDANDMRKFQHSTETYMRENGYPISLGWVALWLNQLDSSLHFTEDLTTIMLPDIKQLRDYYQQYMTNRATIRKAFGVIEL